MKKFFLYFILLFLAFQFIDVTFAQDTETIWRDVTELEGKDEIESFSSPNSFRVYELNVTELKKILDRAPLEFSIPDNANQPLLSLPLPDGTFRIFRIMESPIMAPELSAKYPEIKTYIGRDTDDKSISCRIDITPSGFHSIMFTSSGTIYIDPKGNESNLRYISYFKRDLMWNPIRGNFPEPCSFKSDPVKKNQIITMRGRNEALTIGPELRTYRAAVAATGEYTQFHGGTVPLGLAAVVTAMNRVNGIYEREVAIRMVLVANNDAIIFTNPNTDPYTYPMGFGLLVQNQFAIDSIIGSGNYDIGHVFTTDNGGAAILRVVCVNYIKATGATGSPTPIGDPFWVDRVAHEIGHQYGANHTFNGDEGFCGGTNRNGSTAYEPGSGSTIMSYAGGCGAQNLQFHSDDYFHLISLQEIESYSQSGAGNNCPVVTQTGNASPVVSPISGNYTIPISTPFVLTGSASDPNGDPLTYCWEEWDLGPAGHPDLPTGDAPIFRSFLPVTSPTRIFPQLVDLLNNTHHG